MNKCPETTDNVEEVVLNVIRPTRRQLTILSSFFRHVKRTYEACLNRLGLKGEVTVQGSYAKGTILSDKWEIDIFIILEGVDKEWIKREGEAFLRECASRHLPYTIRYSEHPYITVSMMGLEADIVPVARPEPSRLEGLGVERTPLHTEYVRSKMDRELADQARLLKSFLRGVGVYGAEVRTRGFSGYLAELLTITYGSFRDVLRAASGWRPGVYIDPEGVGDEKVLRRRYRDSVMIVVDPVDPKRNTAAAVSVQSLATFVAAAKLYLEHPHTWFFHACQPSRPPLPGLDMYRLNVDCRGPLYNHPPDAVWGKALRALESLTNRLRRTGFKIAHHTVATDEYHTLTFSIILEECGLSSMEVVQGPYAWSPTERLTKFVLKRLSEGGGAWISIDRMIGSRPRRFKDAAEAARHWLASEESASLHDLGVSCRVVCEKCGHGECNPTPAWIASLLRGRGR